MSHKHAVKLVRRAAKFQTMLIWMANEGRLKGFELQMIKDELTLNPALENDYDSLVKIYTPCKTV